ncbi:OsmC family protein [Rothia sp. ARF10]|nr:OsmC family protein [Rothia sp. ARF10]
MDFEATVSTTGDTSVGEVDPVVVEFRNRHTGQHHELVMDELTGGHVLHLAIAACVSNDLFREGKARGITLTTVRVTAGGGFEGHPCRSTGVHYAVELEGDAPEAALRDLLAHVEDVAEIPAVLRHGATVRLSSAQIRSARTTDD